MVALLWKGDLLPEGPFFLFVFTCLSRVSRRLSHVVFRNEVVSERGKDVLQGNSARSGRRRRREGLVSNISDGEKFSGKERGIVDSI